MFPLEPTPLKEITDITAAHRIFFFCFFPHFMYVLRRLLGMLLISRAMMGTAPDAGKFIAMIWKL